MITALWVGLAVLALLGLPLFLVIFGIAMIGGYSSGLLPEAAFVSVYRTIIDNPLFITIPLFAHAGFVLSESRAPERLVELIRSALGWMPGGAALVAILACALFTAFTGASGVTIIALGGLLYPVLIQERYPERFSLGLVTTGGSLGLLFPPSLPIIVYALIASNFSPIPIETLFLAGVVPGVFLVVVLAVYGAIVGARAPGRQAVPFQPRRVARAIAAAIFEIPIPFIIVVGMFGGYLTLTQAAAAVALYVTIIEVYIYQDLTLADLWRTTTNSMVLVGGILVVIMAALAMTNLLTDQGVPSKILAAMRTYISNPLVFLLVLNVFLLIVGCLMDIYSAILVVVPLIAPIAISFGIDPVHLGIIFLTNLEIGYLTPPVGINLFISSLRFGRPVVDLYRASVSFIALLIGCLIVITYVPALSMGLVRAVEETGSVEVAWAEREAKAGGAGRGDLAWRLRDQAKDGEDPDTWIAPGSPPAEVTDLSLAYGPVDRGQAAELAKGAAPVKCRFRLSRTTETGTKVDVAWEAEVRRLEDLVGAEHELASISILPAGSPLPDLGLGPESWTEAGRAVIESAEGGRVRGTIRGVVLYFPPDEDLPQEIYDLELRFEATAELDTVEPREIPASAPRRQIPDVRLQVRRPEGAEGVARTTFLLERTRPMPWEIGTVWTVEVADAKEIAGREIALDSLRFALADVADLPSTVKKKESLRAARLKIDEVDGDVVSGRIQAVLFDEEKDRTFDVEVKFSLPAKKVD